VSCGIDLCSLTAAYPLNKCTRRAEFPLSLRESPRLLASSRPRSDHGRAHRGRPRRVGLDRACAPAFGLSPIHSRLQMLPRCLRWLYPDPIVLDRLFLEPDQQRNGWQRDLDFRWRRYRGVCRGASALFADLHEQLSIQSIN